METKTSPGADVEELFNLSLDMLCIAGVDGRFIRVNPAFERTLGWSTQELLSRPFFDFIHSDDLEATREEVAKLAEGIPSISFENRYRCRNGQYKYLRWTAQPDAEKVLVYAVARDITERKRRGLELIAAKERAEAADRAKSQFLASISHEIRTPMNGIIGMTELALTSATDARARERLEIIQQSADSLLSLIGDLLDLSKIEAGRIELDDEELAIRDVVGDALKALAVEAHRKGLELVCRVAPRVPERLTGDAVRLRQVLVNLVGNAIKFTSRGEVVVVLDAGRAVDGRIELRFEVRDTGMGVPEDKRASIFDSFTQGQSSASRRYGGTGLGLTISSRLVDRMGGRLRVESEVGVGSVFSFNAALGCSLSSGSSELAAPPEIERVRTLVVDDNSTQREVVVEALSRWHMQATAVDSTAAALLEIQSAESRNQAIDLLLVDLEMGSGSGFDLLETLRSSGKREVAVVLMLTSISPPRDIEHLRRLGLETYLSKPFKEAELLRAILEALGMATRAAPTPALHQAETRLRILVVEDDEINQCVASGVLSALGHEVEVVGDGRTGVDRALSGSFDAVLMDIQMPGMDGLEATAAIRAAESEAGQTTRLPIVAMTALAGEDDRRRCLAAGMDGFMAKPLRAAELLAALDFEPRADSPAPASYPDLPPSDEVFDTVHALTAVNGDRALLGRIAEAAIREVPSLVADLGAAASEADAAAVGRAVHRLRGSIAVFASSALLAPLEELEEQATRGVLERPCELSFEVERRVEQALERVRSLLPSSELERPTASGSTSGGG